LTSPRDSNTTTAAHLDRISTSLRRRPPPSPLFPYTTLFRSNRKTDVNNRGGFSTDMIGANYNWPEASFKERNKIFDDHVSYTKGDRKSTRLNSSHVKISYAVFCLKKKKTTTCIARKYASVPS